MRFHFFPKDEYPELYTYEVMARAGPSMIFELTPDVIVNPEEFDDPYYDGENLNQARVFVRHCLSGEIMGDEYHPYDEHYQGPQQILYYRNIPLGNHKPEYPGDQSPYVGKNKRFNRHLSDDTFYLAYYCGGGSDDGPQEPEVEVTTNRFWDDSDEDENKHDYRARPGAKEAAYVEILNTPYEPDDRWEITGVWRRQGGPPRDMKSLLESNYPPDYLRYGLLGDNILVGDVFTGLHMRGVLRSTPSIRSSYPTLNFGTMFFYTDNTRRQFSLHSEGKI